MFHVPRSVYLIAMLGLRVGMLLYMIHVEVAAFMPGGGWSSLRPHPLDAARSSTTGQEGGSRQSRDPGYIVPRGGGAQERGNRKTSAPGRPLPPKPAPPPSRQAGGASLPAPLPLQVVHSVDIRRSNDSSRSTQRVVGRRGTSKREGCMESFQRLQAMEVRQAGDYEEVFASCQAAGKVLECLMLLKHMRKDGIPRTLDHYSRVAEAALKIGYWNGVMDAIHQAEKKEDFTLESEVWAKMLWLGLKASEKAGKGGKATAFLRLGRRVQPPLDLGPALVVAMRANFRAGLLESAAAYACYIFGLPLPPSLVLPGMDMDVDLSSPSTPPAIDVVAANMAISALAKTNHTNGALMALDRLGEWGVRPDVVSYGAAIEGLAAGGDWQRALRLVDRMTQHGLAPNIIVLNMVLNACCRAGALAAAMNLYDGIKQREGGKTLEPHRIHPLLTAATRAGDEAIVHRILADMVNLEGTVGARCYEASVCNLARLGKHRLALELVHVMEGKGVTPTPVIWSALISAADRMEDWSHLLDYLGDMLKAGHEPDGARYSMGLKACEKLGKWEKAMEVVRHMKGSGQEMDMGMWRRLLVLLGREARPLEALTMLTEMEDTYRDSGHRPADFDVVCYEAPITAYARQGDMTKALACLKKFEFRGVMISRGGYTSAIRSCREMKDWETALALYLRMKERGLKPTAITRGALLSVLVECKRWDEASVVADEQDEEQARRVSSEVVPPAHMMPDLLAVYCRRGEYDRVLEGFRALMDYRAAHGLDSPPAWSTCNYALEACSQTGDFPLAFKILEVMRMNHMPVDVVMYGCVLNACSVATEWRRALALLRDMENRGLQPNLVCYTSVITACQRAGEWRKALNILVRMQNGGPSPDVQVYNAVISACANGGEAQMALKVFKAMMKQGVMPNEVTYATAIVACWKGNMWRQGVEILNLMKYNSLPLNMITVSMVIDTCERNKQSDLASYVFDSSVVGSIRSEDYDPTNAGSPGMVVDLHGYSLSVAKAAVRSGLKRLWQMYLQSNKNATLIKDFVFITGVGRHSAMPFEPVLRPAMQQMMLEEFNPPLPTSYVGGNRGRLVVSAKDLVTWLDAQTSTRAATPAELHGGTLKLKRADELKSAFEQFRKEYEAARQAQPVP